VPSSFLKEGGPQMLYELREYESMPGMLPVLLKRFQENVIPLWEKHGIVPLGFWTTLIGESANVSVRYMIVWESLAEREKKWTAFVVDPEWIAIRDKTEENGPYVASFTNSILTPTTFSKLK